MRFSVIIPLYNKAPYVEKAVRSVLSQTFTDYELIIVDDGSTDGSGERAQAALQTPSPLGEGEGGEAPITPPFREGTGVGFLRQQNAGVSTARNNGVAASKGDYICFLDADDWWEPTFLEEMNQLIEDYPDAGIYGANYYYVKNGKKRVQLDAPTGYINYCKVYAEKLCMPLTSISVAIPRTIFDETGGFKSHLKLGEDFDVWIRIALKHKVAFLNKPLSNYNQDVDVAQRGIGRLRDPKTHMLWNLDYLAEEEKTNPDYKQLIDNLRIYDLYPYWLSKKYHSVTIPEIAKVDWTKQKGKYAALYQKPLIYLRVRQKTLQVASRLKRALIREARTLVHKALRQRWEIGFVQDGIQGVLDYDQLKVNWIKHDFKDRWFADPFILDMDEHTIRVLVEEYRYQTDKGRIALLAINRHSFKLERMKIILELDTHLSFPAIWRDQNRVFVYPENHDSGALRLYELDFKEEILIEKGILCHQPLTDAIMTELFGRRQIISTCMPDPNGKDLVVYDWDDSKNDFFPSITIHFDKSNARMAGNFFQYEGKIYRPAQDCSTCYGGAVNLQIVEGGDIRSLRTVKTFTSPHKKLHTGMHTLNEYNGEVAIDVHGYCHPILGNMIQKLIRFVK